MLLACGMPGVALTAMANPEPQAKSQSVATVTGTILDENDQPVIGASVVQKGVPGNAVTTDIDGKFAIRVPSGAQLNISYIGYKPLTAPAVNGMTVVLIPDNEQLDEVVVVGYGTQKRANLTGAVATVDVAQAMESRPQQDVMKALQGAVPGLTILNSTGNIDATSSIKIRGTGSLSGSTSPLIVVDGVAMDDISYLDPNDIKEISVMKDASSSSIYGTRAAFGVILITTKGGTKRDKIQIKYSNNFAWSQATLLPEMTDNVTQLEAMIQAAKQLGPNEGEFFGQDYAAMLPYAKAWREQNGGKRIDSYGELRPYVDDNNVGDYYMTQTRLLSYADYDINKIFINDAAPSNSHNVSIDGSTGKAVFNVMFGYAKRQNLLNFNPDQVHRYNAKADLQLNIYDWLTAGVRFSYNQRDVQTPNVGSNTFGTVWRFPGFYQMLGYRVYEEDGQAYDFRNEIAYLKQASPIHNTHAQTRMQAWVRAELLKGLTLNADFTYTKHVSDSQYAYLPVTVYDNWFGPYMYPTEAVNQKATTSSKSNAYSNRWTVNAYASYALTVARDHNFKLMLGTNIEENSYHEFNARGKVLLDNNLPAMNLTTGDLVKPGSGDSHWATAGFFGRFNYDYKGIYLFELNGRYDGSSRFPADDQWAFFTSGSIGYRFSEEDYFKPLKHIINNGKLRASYGEIGNQGVGNNRFIATIGTAAYSWIDPATGVLIQGAGTPAVVSKSLSWERIATTDIGLDLNFLHNEITASFDWYQRENKNMLAPGVELPKVLGAGAPYQNAGGMRTRGWELSLAWNHRFGDFGVYASFNIADQRTTITKWNNPTFLIASNYDGKEYGTIWGFETARYYTEDDFERNADGSFKKDNKGAFIPKPGVTDQRSLETGNFHYGPGDIMFVDRDGDGIISGGITGMILYNGNYYVPNDPDYSEAQAALKRGEAKQIGTGTLENHGDVIKMGNDQPRYEYGFHIGGDWKGIDLDIFCQGVGKRDYWTTSSMVIPFTQAANDIFYDHMTSHNSVEFDDKWNIIGYNVDQSNRYPNLYPGGYASNNVPGIGSGAYNYLPQTKYLQDLSYLRVKNITVGYTLPRDLTRKAFIEKLRVYFSGDNLFFIHRGNKDYSPLDPEITATEWSGANTWGRANPMQRSYSFGLQVTF